MSFHFPGPVATRDLVGRDGVVRRVVNRVCNQAQSSAVVGDPFMGKSSVLDAVCEQLRGDEQVHVSRVDIDDLFSGAKARDFWENAFAQVEDALVRDGLGNALQRARDGSFTASACNTLFEQLHRRGAKMVLVIDRFHVVLDRPSLLTRAFLNGLRSSGSTSRGLAVVAGTRLSLGRLDSLSKDIHGGSPFTNTMSPFRLGALRASDVDTLVRRDPRLVPHRDLVARVAGRHPALVQLMGERLGYAMDDHEEPGRARLEACRDVHEASAAVMRAQWDHWRPATRKGVVSCCLRTLGVALDEPRAVPEQASWSADRQALARFVQTLTVGEQRRVAARMLPDGDKSISEGLSQVEHAWRTVELLEQHGCVGRELFRTLIEVRPHHAEQIEVMAFRAAVPLSRATRYHGGGSLRGLAKGGFVTVDPPLVEPEALAWWVADRLGEIARGDASMRSWLSQHALDGVVDETVARVWERAVEGLAPLRHGAAHWVEREA